MRGVHRIIGATIGFIVGFAAPGTSNATSLARMSVVQMAHASAIVVRAKCVASVVRREDGEIWTFSEFEIEEDWKGAANGRITVRLLGGRLGEITSHVAGVPRFQPGEDVVLFLARVSHGAFSVVSWVQGTFRIRRDSRTGREMVTQETASFLVFNAATRQFEPEGIRNLPLSELRDQVTSAIARNERSAE
jgi:hypothetical protein